MTRQLRPHDCRGREHRDRNAGRQRPPPTPTAAGAPPGDKEAPERGDAEHDGDERAVGQSFRRAAEADPLARQEHQAHERMDEHAERHRAGDGCRRSDQPCTPGHRVQRRHRTRRRLRGMVDAGRARVALEPRRVRTTGSRRSRPRSATGGTRTTSHVATPPDTNGSLAATRLDLVSVIATRDDDAAGTRDPPSRHHEATGVVVLVGATRRARA